MDLVRPLVVVRVRVVVRISVGVGVRVRVTYGGLGPPTCCGSFFWPTGDSFGVTVDGDLSCKR